MLIYHMIFKNIFINKKSPLHLAVEKENYGIIYLLLKHKGIDINVKNEVILSNK